MMLSSGTITTFLFDLDGVIRIYLDKDTSLIEEKYGLALGTIDEIAFSNDLLIKVTTGKIKRHEWVRMIGIRMNNLQAALEWESRPVYVNREVLDIIRKLRSIGFQVCLVTNGTDNLLNEFPGHEPRLRAVTQRVKPMEHSLRTLPGLWRQSARFVPNLRAA